MLTKKHTMRALRMARSYGESREGSCFGRSPTRPGAQLSDKKVDPKFAVHIDPARAGKKSK